MWIRAAVLRWFGENTFKTFKTSSKTRLAVSTGQSGGIAKTRMNEIALRAPVPDSLNTTLDPSVKRIRTPWFLDTLPSIGSVYSKSSMPTCAGGHQSRGSQ